MSLAFFAFGRRPRSWYAVGAALPAVRVASAQDSGTVADKLCEMVEIVLRQGIDIPATCIPWSKRPNIAAGFAGDMVRRSRRRCRPALATQFKQSPPYRMSVKTCLTLVPVLSLCWQLADMQSSADRHTEGTRSAARSAVNIVWPARADRSQSHSHARWV